jgi:hypothetical protein
MPVIQFAIVPSEDGGLYLVKTITLTDSCGNNVTTSSSVPLRLTDGERLPKNIQDYSLQWVIDASIINVCSSTRSKYNRIWAWKIEQDDGSLDPITSDNVVFLGEYGQIVRNKIPDMYDMSGMTMTQIPVTRATRQKSMSVVSLEVSLLPPRGGIAKKKSFLLCLRPGTRWVKNTDNTERRTPFLDRSSDIHVNPAPVPAPAQAILDDECPF